MEQKQPTGYPSIDKPWEKYYEKETPETLRIPESTTVWDFVEAEMKKRDSADAVEYFGRKISVDSFIESVNAWARALKAIGVQADEVVPVYGPWFPEMGYIACAMNMIGAASYFLKLSISQEALEQETGESRFAIVYDGMWDNVKSVFAQPRFSKVIFISATDSMRLPLKLASKLSSIVKPGPKLPVGEKYMRVKTALALGKTYPGELRAAFVKNRSAFITSSSGTSINGVVKGTIATNETVIAQQLLAKWACINYHAGTKCFTHMPPTASTSLFCLFLYPLAVGLTVILDPRLNEEMFYDQIMKYKPAVTAMTGSFWETFFRRLENELAAGKNISLEFFDMPIIGGEGVTLQDLHWMNGLMRKCHAKVNMFNGYGLSEAFSCVAVDKIDANMHDPQADGEIPCVGLPYPGVTMGVFDDRGNEQTYGNRGELWVKTPSLVKGYYGKDLLTRQAIVNDWLHTGDIAKIFPNGELCILGRKNDCIMPDTGEPIYFFDIVNKIIANESIRYAIVNRAYSPESKYAVVAHIVFEDGVQKDKNDILLEVDADLKKFLPKCVRVLGYKEHDKTLPSSPTTAKKDRNGLMKVYSGYKLPTGNGLIDVELDHVL